MRCATVQDKVEVKWLKATLVGTPSEVEVLQILGQISSARDLAAGAWSRAISPHGGK